MNWYFEHFDERMEDWFKNSSSAVYIDQTRNTSLRSDNLKNYQGYNSFDNTLVFRDEVLDLNEILAALEALHDKCK